MAGIGLALRRTADQGGLFGPVAAFGFAAALAAGPYLGSSLAIVAIGALAPSEVSREALALVAYATAIAVIVVSPLQFVGARVLGDLLHEHRPDTFGAVFTRLLGPLLATLALIASLLLAALPFDLPTRAAAFMLCLAQGGTWLALVPLSAGRGYLRMVATFVAGMGAGSALAIELSPRFGLAGLVGGLACGHAAVFVGLVAQIDREFGPPDADVPDLWQRLAARWPLAVAGGAYGLGIWVDKLIFWVHPLAPNVPITGILSVCPLYDNGMSLAALTTVPALALFVMLAETDLARNVRDYLATIEARAALPTVERARERLARESYANLGLLALAQGVITLGVVLFAPELVGAIKLPWLSVFVFRIGAVGAYLQLLFMATQVHLFYLDRARPAAVLSTLFLVANAALTCLAMTGGLSAYGYGFTAAAGMALLAGLWALERTFTDLEFHVFMRQGT